MASVVTTIGPGDHGRRMSLDEFEHAEAQEGSLYELSRGVIRVVDVPHPKHLMIVAAVRRQLTAHQEAHPNHIHVIAAGSECKILLADLQSERHPDLAVYRTPPPEGNDVWSIWIPELVVEVISPTSRERDMVEKREEYLAFGVQEYWIIDPERSQWLALRRYRGRWRDQTVAAGETYTTPLFKGLKLDLAAVLPPGWESNPQDPREDGSDRRDGMASVVTTIGPGDHGRRMSLDEFEHAEAQEGSLYELSRGTVTVVDVPHPSHMAIVLAVRDLLIAYKLAHPGRVHAVAGGAECKILLADLQSERHPDLAVYRTPPPEGNDVWSIWIPELVVEVISPTSRERDMVEKREEYLAFGVQEYWIIDPERSQWLALRRYRGRWRDQTVAAGETYTTPLFKGLKLDLAAVLPLG